MQSGAQVNLAMQSGAQGIVFLIDNSSSSLNGDFYPNRLDAQKNAVEKLATYYSKTYANSHFALGTLGSSEFGIVVSPSLNTTAIFRRLPQLKRGGESDLTRGIRCSLLSLHLTDPAIQCLRIVAMMGSNFQPPLTPEICHSLSAALTQANVWLDIIAFGDDVQLEPLQYLIDDLRNPNCHFVYCPPGGLILSDAVLDSPLGPGLEAGRRAALDDIENDPDLAEAVRKSLAEQEADDPAVQQALSESMEGFSQDDIDLARVIEESLREKGPKRAEDEKKQDGEAGEGN
jgi:26S proteasome regulatory subunit N10